MTAPTATRTHIVTGAREEVRTALEHAHAAGRLVTIREAAELPDGRLHVVAELREPAASTPAPSPWWCSARGRWLAAGYGAAVVAAGGLAVGLVVAVVALVSTVVAAIAAAAAWVTANLAGLLGLGVLVLALLGGGARCAGLHCGGCRR